LNEENARRIYKLTYIKTKNFYNKKIKRKLGRFLEEDDGTKYKWEI